MNHYTANPFRPGMYMTCEKCGRIAKSYPDFESQWTAVSVEGSQRYKYYCPNCWGISDPAPNVCAKIGHAWEQTKRLPRLYCFRCGHSENQ